MRLVSIATLWQEMRQAFLRFPAMILCGAGAAWVAIRLVNGRGSSDSLTFSFMALAMGIPLFFALRLVQEKPPWGRSMSAAAGWATVAAGVVLLLGYRHLLGRETGTSGMLRYFQLTLALDLAVAIAPFLGRGESNGFWQFNRRLFLRFFLSGIYATVFFGGLALAILAVDRLFDLKVDSDVYPRLWFFTVFLFMPWHFVAGVPRDLAALEHDTEHPKGLRIFSQYLLVPLVVLYLAILYAYTAKILLSREWPQGWVGWLVSGASGFGVLTVLLLQPGRPEPERRWVDRFARGFEIAILPLLVLLFAALSRRVDQYGMTERRYWLLILGVWLGGVALYLLVRRGGGIKAVPATLALTALVTSFGPWGAYQVSIRSQAGRLERLLARHGLLSGGLVTRGTADVPNEDVREISAVVDYFVSYHGVGSLDRYVESETARGRDATPRWRARGDAREAFMKAMGLEYLRSWESPESEERYYARNQMRDVAGYERMFDCYFLRGVQTEAKGYWGRLDDKGLAVEIREGPTTLLTMPLRPLLARLESLAPDASRTLAPEDLCLEAQSERLRARACFQTMDTRQEGQEELAVWTADGYVLIDEHP